MANPVPLDLFIEKVRQIYNSHPTYRQPGDGSDGTCDCIGLIIGAIRRAGGSWTGIHGSNYAARFEVSDLHDINSPSDCYVGMAVFKFNTDQTDLPDRYKNKSSKYYTGDLLDYYHVGVVTNMNPFRIVHMTSPTARVDTQIGKWRKGGHLIKVAYDGGGGIVVEKFKAKVVVPEGTSTVNLRAKPSTSSALVAQIPKGTILPIFDDSGDMWLTEYNSLEGYVKSTFLQKVEDGGGDDPEVGIFIPLPKSMISDVLEALKKAKSCGG